MAKENIHREALEQDCPRPEIVPSPLLDEYLSLVNDPKSKLSKVDDGAKDYDWYIFTNPDLKELYWDVAIQKGRDPHTANDVAYLNGDGYSHGQRISYYDLINNGQPAGPYKQIDIKFGFHGSNSYVASQIITDDSLAMKQAKVNAATFDHSGRLLTFKTGEDKATLKRTVCRKESE